MEKIAYLYGHGLQGGNKILLANQFAKDGTIVTLFGRYHISKTDITQAEEMMEDKIKDLIAEKYTKIKIVLVGFSPLVAVMYGWYIKNRDKYSGLVESVYYLKELGSSRWEEIVL